MSFDLIGVGSPILDLLARVPESHLDQVGGASGGMELVTAERLDALVMALPVAPTLAPGGSAGNTAVGVAQLGLRTSFVGKLGPDAAGDYYCRAFASAGGDTSRFKRGTVPNGRCLSLVTPNGQRTMRTDLGAALTLRPEEISAADFAGCRLVHIEGYLLFNRELMLAVVRAARSAGCKLSLSLASFEVVRAAADILPELLRETTLVFANEDEAAAFAGGSPEDGLRAFQSLCSLAVVTCGAAGALVGNCAGHRLRVPAVPVGTVVDTTGAGDAFAAGFLAAWLREQEPEVCAQQGARVAAEVVQNLGAGLSAERWATLRVQARTGAIP